MLAKRIAASGVESGYIAIIQNLNSNYLPLPLPSEQISCLIVDLNNRNYVIKIEDYLSFGNLFIEKNLKRKISASYFYFILFYFI